MARIRSAKPELLEDEKAGPLPHDTWRLFVSSWLLADDYGNFRASPLLVHGAVFWAWPEADVARMLRQLGDAGMLSFYTVRGQRYAHITTWDRHQKVDHPGKPLCPGPDEGGADPGGGVSTPPGDQRSTDSRESREDSPTISCLTGTGTGIRTRTIGRSEDTSSSGVAAGTPPAPAAPALLVFETVKGKRGGAEKWSLTAEVLAELAECFPDLEVLAACRAALAWVRADRTRRKTGDGMRRFLTTWLSRAQNRGEHRRPNGSTQGGPKAAPGGGLADYCDWHKDARNDGKPSRRPRPTCPCCKELTARERVGSSDGPTPAGAIVDELPAWAGGNGVAR